MVSPARRLNSLGHVKSDRAPRVGFEIALLMYCQVYFATRVAWALDIRLSPLNADRAFVADSLVRVREPLPPQPPASVSAG